MKFLLWGLIIAAIVFWVMRSRKVPSSKQDHSAREQADAGESMVRCAHCGIHLPRSEALIGRSGERVYCSDEHRRLANGD